MTKRETEKILTLVVGMYPAFKKDRDAEVTVMLWSDAFKDAPYSKVESALREYYATDEKGFAPVPGALRHRMMGIAAENELSGPEAWSILYRAIGNGSYHSREEFEKLPPVIRDIVGNPNELHHWAQSEERYVKGSVCSWFLRAYNSSMEKDRKDALIPPGACFALPESAAAEDD